MHTKEISDNSLNSKYCNKYCKKVLLHLYIYCKNWAFTKKASSGKISHSNEHSYWQEAGLEGARPSSRQYYEPPYPNIEIPYKRVLIIACHEIPVPERGSKAGTRKYYSRRIINIPGNSRDQKYIVSLNTKFIKLYSLDTFVICSSS